MSLLRFPQGHGPVTVSLLLPLLTLASSLAFRPSPATAPAGATVGEPDATVAAAPATHASAKSCDAPAVHACPTGGEARQRVVLVEALAAPRPAAATEAATVAVPGSPAFGFELANAVAAPLVTAALDVRVAGFSYAGDDEMPMLLMDPREGESWGFWSSDHDASLRRLRRTEKSPFLWFRHEGREYVIRDAALLGRAREIVEPQTELGRAQGELGGVQGSVGGEQGRLGARQGAYGAELGALAQREARLQSRLHRRSLTAADERRIEAELDEVRERRERVQAAMESYAAGQAKLAARQAKLAERQAEFARRQAELTRQVTRDLRALVREALRDGKAVRLGTEIY